MPSDLRPLCRAAIHSGPSHQGSPPQPPSPSLLPPGCEVVPDVNVSGQKFCIKLLVPSPEGMSEIYLRCQDVREGQRPGPLEARAKRALGRTRPGGHGAGPGQGQGAGPGLGQGPHLPPPPFPPQEQQYARWMAGCRLASKGRTMADSSYSSEVQAILAFLSLQRTGGGSGGGGSGNHPQGPDASAEGLNPYGLVAPRFQRKFKAKQVPGRVGGGTDQRVYLANLGPWISTEPSLGNARTHSLLLPPGS